MSATATVVSVNLSPGGIPKRPVESAALAEPGFAGDGHHHAKHVTPLQAVSLLDAEDLRDLRAEGYDVGPGALGENLTVEGLQVDELRPGDRLVFAGGVELEYTKARRPCYVLDAISPQLKTVVAGRCGGYARVITAGRIGAGERVERRHVAPVS
jgi:MOSC domain-containing protein YiiM